jgi:L-erythro-3,5-diaminohexanoate dehydrogenase
VVLTALDVYPAASHARALAAPGDHVLVLGAGHAGLLASAAAHEAVGPAGRVTALDASEAALAHMRDAQPATSAIRADATDTVGALAALRAHGLPRADLTLVCTSAPGCEGTAILATDEAGAVLFFSTATSFPAAALGADSVSSRTRLVIPNGYTDDRGGYALDLLRRDPALRAAIEGRPA